jgi:hypothetical protein
VVSSRRARVPRADFEPWSRCEHALIAKLSRRVKRRGGANETLGTRAIPTWRGVSSLLEPIVRFQLLPAADGEAVVLNRRKLQERTHSLVAKHNRCAPPLGRSWWWVQTWERLFRFRASVERRALQMLAANGVGDGARDGAADYSRFIVAHIRHGGKHVEEDIIGVDEYILPLEALTSSGCFDTPHVLIVTETQRVVTRMEAICAERGWRCFYTDQQRLDLDVDPHVRPRLQHRQ